MKHTYAFTMAEILLSLTIIGVIAAITLPSLTGNINERTWNTQRKALYARMSQAISLMPSVNGYGVVKEDENGSTIEDTAAETFITEGLSKVLQINNICDSTHITDCGLASKLTTLDGTQLNLPNTMKDLNPLMAGSFDNELQSFYIPNTKIAAFETKNGESFAVYVNPHCIGDLNSIHIGGYNGQEVGELFQRTVCANFIYDLNRSKGPNTIGKDIGVMTVMYPSDPVVVAPNPATKITDDIPFTNASRTCTNFDPEYRIPNLEELYSMFVNKNLLKPSGFRDTIFWSSKIIGRQYDIAVAMNRGEVDDYWGGNHPTWCVKR